MNQATQPIDPPDDCEDGHQYTRLIGKADDGPEFARCEICGKEIEV